MGVSVGTGSVQVTCTDPDFPHPSAICQREEGDAAGALTTYRRCRELLSIVLGRKPAAETEAVRATLA